MDIYYGYPLFLSYLFLSELILKKKPLQLNQLLLTKTKIIKNEPFSYAMITNSLQLYLRLSKFKATIKHST